MYTKNKLVYGWGINDVSGIYVSKDETRKREPYYKDWICMLQRCFDTKLQEKHPTYKDCTVCEEWKYLSNFIKWVDSQQNKEWQNCCLDKDLLVQGNKHYSPDTCVYIPKRLNCFITDRVNYRGDFMVGVNYIKDSEINPYRARCCDPFDGKYKHLGVFSTEMEAHLAWKAKKHEYACSLADAQNDTRVAEALRQRYAPDKDWSKR